jgi:protein-tyrosine phosphatase
MEPDQKNKIKHVYSHLDLPPIEVLNIADDYEFMDEELIEILHIKMDQIISQQSDHA